MNVKARGGFMNIRIGNIGERRDGLTAEQMKQIAEISNEGLLNGVRFALEKGSKTHEVFEVRANGDRLSCLTAAGWLPLNEYDPFVVLQTAPQANTECGGH